MYVILLSYVIISSYLVNTRKMMICFRDLTCCVYCVLFPIYFEIESNNLVEVRGLTLSVEFVVLGCWCASRSLIFDVD